MVPKKSLILLFSFKSSMHLQTLAFLCQQPNTSIFSVPGTAQLVQLFNSFVNFFCNECNLCFFQTCVSPPLFGVHVLDQLISLVDQRHQLLKQQLLPVFMSLSLLPL